MNQVVQAVLHDFWNLLSFGTLIASTVKICKCIVKRHFARQKESKIKKMPIYQINEALQLAKKQQKLNDKDKTYLIKVKPEHPASGVGISSTKSLLNRPYGEEYNFYPYEKHQIIKMQNISCNQIWIMEPSLKQVANSMTWYLNKAHQKNVAAIKYFQNQKAKANLNWVTKIRVNGKQTYQQIQGFGQILDSQIFDVKTKYYPKQSMGFFKQFLAKFAYVFQLLFFYKNHQTNKVEFAEWSRTENRGPNIKGPVYGQIFYLFSLFYDRNFLIEAKIEGSKIIPLVSSTSKKIMLQNLSTIVLGYDVEIAIHLIMGLLSFKYSKNFIKRIYRYFTKTFFTAKNSIKQISMYISYKPESQGMQDTKLCIICYSNVRNTILFDCKHLIMCDQCYREYKNHNCPLCKQNIDKEIKLVQPNKEREDRQLQLAQKRLNFKPVSKLNPQRRMRRIQ